MSFTVDDMLAALELEPTGDHTFRTRHADSDGEPRVVFGGELLGQAIVAAGLEVPTKRVKSVQVIFARGAHTGSGVDITVEVMHDGRKLGSATVTFAQDDRLCCRALVLLDAEEPDLVRHQPPMPEVDPPDASAAQPNPLAAPETIIVGDVDVNDPARVGPPTLQLWVRYDGAPADQPNLLRALLAHATDGWLIATLYVSGY